MSQIVGKDPAKKRKEKTPAGPGVAPPPALSRKDGVCTGRRRARVQIEPEKAGERQKVDLKECVQIRFLQKPFLKN